MHESAGNGTVIVKSNTNGKVRAFLSLKNILAELAVTSLAILLSLTAAVALSSLLATRGATFSLLMEGEPLNGYSSAIESSKDLSNVVKTRRREI